MPIINNKEKFSAKFLEEGFCLLDKVVKNADFEKILSWYIAQKNNISLDEVTIKNNDSNTKVNDEIVEFYKSF